LLRSDAEVFFLLLLAFVSLSLSLALHFFCFSGFSLQLILLIASETLLQYNIVEPDTLLHSTFLQCHRVFHSMALQKKEPSPEAF
jgi:hypothetical protein